MKDLNTLKDVAEYLRRKRFRFLIPISFNKASRIFKNGFAVSYNKECDVGLASTFFLTHKIVDIFEKCDIKVRSFVPLKTLKMQVFEKNMSLHVGYHELLNFELVVINDIMDEACYLTMMSFLEGVGGMEEIFIYRIECEVIDRVSMSMKVSIYFK